MHQVQNNYFMTAKKQVVNGIKYDSKFEAGYAQELELKKKAGQIKNFEAHKKIELIVNGETVCNYYIDFVVHHNDDTIEFVETKGYRTDVWKIKWKIFEAIYGKLPGVKLTIIQQCSWTGARWKQSKQTRKSRKFYK